MQRFIHSFDSDDDLARVHLDFLKVRFCGSPVVMVAESIVVFVNVVL